MSSTILLKAQDSVNAVLEHDATPAADRDAAEAAAASRHPFLSALGERVRMLRAQRGMTRKALALASEVSERHLANLEYGTGNASMLVLLQVAQALQCPLAELIGEPAGVSPEWLLIRDLLGHRDEATLRRVRAAIGDMLGSGGDPGGGRARPPRIALIGLRGAGKSTLGALLAEDLGCTFVELSREIEKLAGCSVAEIHNLYGQEAYRRYERRALEATVRAGPAAVIATPGGIVSDPASFDLMLAHCTTVWLKASPEDHMKRVVAQGDLRPMAASREAMDDLKNILAGRTPSYAKADLQVDTSARSLAGTFQELRAVVRSALSIPLDRPA
jgi:XRE family aerobic/anaerobic benzoate catabolism transcriptional regulator